MILNGAQSVLGYFGFDRTIYEDIKKYNAKKMEMATTSARGPPMRVQTLPIA